MSAIADRYVESAADRADVDAHDLDHARYVAHAAIEELDSLLRVISAARPEKTLFDEHVADRIGRTRAKLVEIAE